MICDSCGRIMTVQSESGAGMDIIGLTFNIECEDPKIAEQIAQLYPELITGKQYAICPVCMLRRLGVMIGGTTS